MLTLGNVESHTGNTSALIAQSQMPGRMTSYDATLWTGILRE